MKISPPSRSAQVVDGRGYAACRSAGVVVENRAGGQIHPCLSRLYNGAANASDIQSRLYTGLFVSVTAWRDSTIFAPIGVEGHANPSATDSHGKVRGSTSDQALRESRYQARHGCNSIFERVAEDRRTRTSGLVPIGNASNPREEMQVSNPAALAIFKCQHTARGRSRRILEEPVVNIGLREEKPKCWAPTRAEGRGNVACGSRNEPNILTLEAEMSASHDGVRTARNGAATIPDSTRMPANSNRALTRAAVVPVSFNFVPAVADWLPVFAADRISDGKRRTSLAIRPTAPVSRASRNGSATNPAKLLSIGSLGSIPSALTISLRVDPQNDHVGEAGRNVDSQGYVNPSRSGMRRKTDMPNLNAWRNGRRNGARPQRTGILETDERLKTMALTGLCRRDRPMADGQPYWICKSSPWGTKRQCIARHPRRRAGHTDSGSTPDAFTTFQP